MKPYYQDDHVTLYHGDCREVDAWLAADVLVTDPPYGIGYQPDATRSALCETKALSMVAGDDEPFDPSHLLAMKRCLMFGANHYADRLPTSPSWIVWDKLDGLTSDRPLGFNDNADVELIWTNLGGPARIVRHRWMGLMKASEHGENRVHPTQKPLALMTRLVALFSEPGETVADPYAGSGTTLRAAKDLGRKAIGVELDERYCEIAAKRCAQEVLDFGGAA